MDRMKSSSQNVLTNIAILVLVLIKNHLD